MSNSSKGGAQVDPDFQMKAQLYRAFEFIKLAEQNRDLLTSIQVQVPCRPEDGMPIPMTQTLSVWSNQGIQWHPMLDYQGGFIEVMRARMAWNFLRSPKQLKYLLMLDSDMEPPFELPYLLARHQEPVVGGACMSVSARWGPMLCFTVKDEAEKLRFPTLLRENNGHVAPNMIPEKGLVEVGHVGTGAMLIRRDVLESFTWEGDDVPFFVSHETRMKGVRLGELRRGEDIEFCRQVRAKGFKVHVDLEAHVGHRKTTTMSWPAEQRVPMDVSKWTIPPEGMPFED